MMNDLYDVGPNKPMGYLPKNTITELAKEDINSVIEQLKAKNLTTFIIEEDQGSHVVSGALYAYDRQALANLLQDNLEIVHKVDWPSDPDEFAKKVAVEFVSDPELFRLIAYGFADPRPEYQRPKH